MATSPVPPQQIDELAEASLTYLIANPEELSRFMDFAGLDGAALKSAIGSSSLNRGLIDYVAHNESVLLAVCANGGLTPERFMSVWHRLNPGHG